MLISLFGKLLSDRQQNVHALKNTLKTAWKLGSDLRIVEVGNDILQFKFRSRYQMEWVEKSGPWNFENNLLFLCRWKKGLSSTNIVFMHTPFWVQVWGLPFEFMNEEVGKDIGGTIGNLLEVDKCSWQSNQAKFMNIRVDVHIKNPLQRGGYVSSPKGVNHWVAFKYERLPTLCSMCGRIGHDIKHCLETTNGQEIEKQYGEWIRAGWNSKGEQSRTRITSSEAQTTTEMETGNVGYRVPSDNSSIPESVGLGENNISKENPALGNVPEASIATNQTALLLQVAKN
ncbi:uncharacterized protein LOC126721931 [Quercus robur]|uniref:uncharacterized protein LOC126721931 n=1 Tax=Quercus robur TaxID=38942 RepID=UPI00216358A6|nr:uncharacterized protein LOC126721931 [Quercus robur]